MKKCWLVCSLLVLALFITSCGSDKKNELTALVVEYEQLMEKQFEISKKALNAKEIADITRLQGETLAHIQKIAKWTEKWQKALTDPNITVSDSLHATKEYQKLLTKWESKIADLSN